MPQSVPDVPLKYQRLIFKYSDQRRLYEKALNVIGLTTLPVGRSYAIIAGVTQYPNFPKGDQTLAPAAVEIEKLKLYLKDQEYFDEIIVIRDADFELETLNYFLQSYLPGRLAGSPHSRFLFAFSGHGYAESPGETAKGFFADLYSNQREG